MRYFKENKTENDKKCGMRLKECREAKNLTQQQLAEMVSYTTQQISNYERGTRGFASAVHSLAKVLDVSVEYLLCQSEYKNEKEEWESDRKSVIATDDLVVKILKQEGVPVYVQVKATNELIEYDKLDMHTYGRDDVQIVLNGQVIEVIDFQYMLDDMLDQIQYICSRAKEYSNRRDYHVAMCLAKSSERNEKSLGEILESMGDGIISVNGMSVEEFRKTSK